MTSTTEAATMPREYLDLTIADMRVGETAFCPRSALKLDPDGRCYLVGDRVIRRGAANEEHLPLCVTRGEDGFTVVAPGDISWSTDTLREDDDATGEAAPPAFPVTALVFTSRAPSAYDQVRLAVHETRGLLRLATADYAAAALTALHAHRAYTRSSRDFGDAEDRARVALLDQGVAGRTVAERDGRIDLALADDPTLYPLRAAMGSADEELRAAHAAERVADQRQKALRVELEALTALVRGELR